VEVMVDVDRTLQTLTNLISNAREAEQGAATALGLAGNREVEYGAAVASGLAGDSRQAEALADHLESGFPEDTSVRFSYLPVIHAILALNRGDPARAIHALEPAMPYELGSPRCAVVGFYGSLYPILFRGEAYLAAHKGPEAAREYQKLIDHRGIMIGDPVSVLAVMAWLRVMRSPATQATRATNIRSFSPSGRTLIPISQSCRKPEQSLRDFTEINSARLRSRTSVH
jgi:hypothetical protein